MDQEIIPPIDAKPKKLGVGRPKGATNTRSREIAMEALKNGISPLEVMVNAMREAYALATKPDEPGAERMPGAARILLMEKAVTFAVSAAPYMHPRLQSVQLSGNPDAPIEHRMVVSQKLVRDVILEIENEV